MNLDDIRQEYSQTHANLEARIMNGEITRDQAQSLQNLAWRIYLFKKFKVTKDRQDLLEIINEFRHKFLDAEKRYLDGAVGVLAFNVLRRAAWNTFETYLINNGVGNPLATARATDYFGRLQAEEDKYKAGNQTYVQMCLNNEVIFQQYLDEFLT